MKKTVKTALINRKYYIREMVGKYYTVLADVPTPKGILVDIFNDPRHHKGHDGSHLTKTICDQVGYDTASARGTLWWVPYDMVKITTEVVDVEPVTLNGGFKVGDIVRCIRETYYSKGPRHGNIYEVVGNGDDLNTLNVKDNGGSLFTDWYANRYELVKAWDEGMDKQPPREFQPGDQVLCVEGSGDRRLKEGEAYTFKGWAHSPVLGKVVVLEETQPRFASGYYPKRFTLFTAVEKLPTPRPYLAAHAYSLTSSKDPTPMTKTTNTVMAKPDTIKLGTFIISSIEGGKFTPAHKPRTYSTDQQAIKVAHDMAAKHKGTRFVVLESIGYVEVPEPVVPTSRFVESSMPFNA